MAQRIRSVFAAAHVVYRSEVTSAELSAPTAEAVPELIDWERTRAFRRHLAGHGFGVAEAMDTAQRFELGWPAARRLIEECGALELEHGFVAGAGVDHLAEGEPGEADLIQAVLYQARVIKSAGGTPVILPLFELPARDADEETYVRVYDAIARGLEGESIIHWLGEAFAPRLAGYFPGSSFERVMAAHPDVWRGAKLSLLDDAFEVRTRRALLERDQVVWTGDDLHFGRLIRGGDPVRELASAPVVERCVTFAGRELALGDFSHALLGVFDAVAAPMARALELLEAGDVAAYEQLAGPCEALGRHLFEPPTSSYKAGLAYLARCAGHQPDGRLLGGLEGTRDEAHYARAATLARAAGVLDPEGSA